MEECTKKKFSVWKLMRNLVIGVVAVICIIAMGSRGGSGGLQERYFVGMYRINDKNYYTTSDSVLMRWYYYELWQDEEGDDTRIHRFPEGTVPLWSKENQAFFYEKGKSIYRWDPETDQTTKVYTMERPALWDSVQDFFLSRVSSIWAVMGDQLLVRRSDRLPLLVNMKTGMVTELERLREYTSVMALDDYLVFSGYEKPLYIIMRENGETVNSLPFESFSVDLLDAYGNQLLFQATVNRDQVTLWWYDADQHDLQKIVPQEPYEKLNVSAEAKFAWGDVVYFHKGIMYRIDIKGNPVSMWELPFCEEIQVFEVLDDDILWAGTSYAHDIPTSRRILTYYQLTQDGQVKEVYEWNSILYHALNDCQVIIDGDQVISGCPAEAEWVRFTVE
ncbi:MAG: hypothetical protein IKT45_06825 [Lachnospiraceae bacterium]|nr:hypothetical protein [Lachnospiraceae bacterium]